MAFEEIEWVGKVAPIDAVPAMGVRLRPRKLITRRVGRGVIRYIELTLGPALARKLALHGDKSALRLLFGTGDDAGKIGLTVDASQGKFPDKKRKDGTWSTTINAASAEGLFALEFPPFCVEPEMVTVAGKPPFAVIAVSEAMLAVED